MRNYDNAPPNTIARKQTPRSLTSEDTHSLVKLGLFVAVLLFMAALCGLMFWDQLDKSRGMTFGGQLKGAFACSSVGLLLVVAGVPFLMWRSRSGVLRDVLFEIEEVTGVDVNRDGVVGHTTQVLLPTGPREYLGGEFDVDIDLLIEWAGVATENGSLSFSRWKKDWPDGETGYTKFREKLTRLGHLRRLPNNSVRLTPKGDRFFRQVAKLDVTHPPADSGVSQLLPETRMDTLG